jgi:Tfp pilus assembly protein PilW
MNIRRNAGFSLVELMVAMVLALIVIGAVIALVLSMMRANNQTISATRLTQELRATAALMEADLRRAGGVLDPLTSATAIGGQPDTTLATINTATAGCVIYSYAGAEGGNFHSLSLQNGAVFLDAGATAADATCNGGTRLSSQQVSITGLTFARTGRRIDITMNGQLANNADIRRSYTQSVYVRSVAGT